MPIPLVAYSATDGTEVWRLGLAMSGPGLPAAGSVVAGGVIVALIDDGSGGGNVAGIDATTGAVLWQTTEERRATLLAGTDTVVVGRSAFVPPAPGIVTSQPLEPTTTLWGIDRVTGNRLWETEVPLGEQTDPFETVTIDGDAFVTSDGPAKYSIATGALVWSDGDPIMGVIGGSGDGVFVTGGQDDPTSGHDSATGDRVWTNDGRVAYDNVWAIGDGAVYLIDGSRSALTAHELATGDVRWTVPWDQQRDSWPFHATEDTVYLMWTNIDAVATADGTPRWSTSYTPDQDHRFAGAVSNTTTLITAIHGPSGGD
jgi:glucose dehydrogenase